MMVTFGIKTQRGRIMDYICTESDVTFKEIKGRDRLVALHEAGHGLVCCFLAYTHDNISYPEITLEAQGSDFGYTHWSLLIRGEDGARAKVKLAYGGFVAVSESFGPDIACLGSSEDFERIKCLGFSLGENLAMKAEVVSIIQVYRGILMKLQDELLVKRHLSKLETRDIWLKGLKDLWDTSQ